MAPETITKTSETRLKSQLASDKIRDWIEGGQYIPGERLPSERELAEMLGFNHLTVRRGLATLATEGVIEKRPNVGSFVAASQRVTALALVLPEYLHFQLAGHPWTGLVTAGACSGFDATEYSLSTLFYKSGRLWEDTGTALQNLSAKGVLLAVDSSVSTDHVQRILDQGIQVVCLQDSPRLARLGLPVVQPDYEVTLMQLIHGLVDRGHRRVRVAMYECNPLRESMLTTLRIALEQTGLGSLDDVLLDLPNRPGVSLSDTYRVMGELMDSASGRPTAIVVPDEFAAADLFQSCYRRGIRVPDDLSVAALLDHTPHAYPVPLTAPDSIDGSRLVGSIAASELISLVRGNSCVQRQTLTNTQIVWRESVADLDV